MAIITFLIFLTIFAAIGACSAIKSKGTSSDYLMAGQSVPPWLVALSAVSTNNSGYMFIGQIGFTYTYGLCSIWLMVGWLLGDFVVSLLVHRRLREVSEEKGFLSFGDVLSRWHGTNFKYLRVCVGVIVLVFLGTYAAAQFKAGSKALHVLFQWDYSVGAILGAVIVMLYCVSGGIRASIWTDAAQSFAMIFSMALLLWISIDQIGGSRELYNSLQRVSPEFVSLWPAHVSHGVTGVCLWILGWFFGGAAVIGMPHVMVRFMALNDSRQMNRTRFYYYTWFMSFYAASIGVGLVARVLLPEVQSFDAELALPLLSKQLLPPVLVGLMLAGLFAATMSTADSLILSCSASLIHDVIPEEKVGYWMTKVATVLITLIALGIALYGSGSVFVLVLFAVSVLASAFGPILVLYCTGVRLSEGVALTVMLAGASIAILWKVIGLSDVIYEVAPGMLGGIVVWSLLHLVEKAPGKDYAEQRH